jgi:thioredoxin-like negative regulator of GroEL
MSKKYTNVVFFKVDVDEAEDVAEEVGITAMPTFQFYKDGKKIEEFKGANPEKLEETIKKLM